MVPASQLVMPPLTVIGPLEDYRAVEQSNLPRTNAEVAPISATLPRPHTITNHQSHLRPTPLDQVQCRKAAMDDDVRKTGKQRPEREIECGVGSPPGELEQDVIEKTEFIRQSNRCGNVSRI